MVFRVCQVVEGDLMIRRLADIEMVLVASPMFIEAWGNPGTIADLGELPFARYAIIRFVHTFIRFMSGESIVTRGRLDC